MFSGSAAAASSGSTPSLASITSLLSKVNRQYDSALKAKSIFFYPSKVSILSQNVHQAHNRTAAASLNGQSNQNSTNAPTIPWVIRCVPALLDKAKEKTRQTPATTDAASATQHKEPESKGQNPSDVFAPPYHPDLLIEELPEHTLLLNKFCVVPRHFLLVTREFQPQSMPPTPDTLAIAFRILHAHRRLAQEASQDVDAGKEMLAFYNCGEVSGASQPHQHMQFAELGGGQVASGSESHLSIPIEDLLDRVPKDENDAEGNNAIYALPLPYQHFVSLIKDAPIDDDGGLTQYLAMKLLGLMDALFHAQMKASVTGQEAEGSSDPWKTSPSWNLLLTTRAMHLIPRRRENFTGLQAMVQQEGASLIEDGVDLVGPLSINSLGYAGHLLVKSEEELKYLQRYPGGIAEVLTQTGVPPVADVTAPSTS